MEYQQVTLYELSPFVGSGKTAFQPDFAAFFKQWTDAGWHLADYGVTSRDGNGVIELTHIYIWCKP